MHWKGKRRKERRMKANVFSFPVCGELYLKRSLTPLRKKKYEEEKKKKKKKKKKRERERERDTEDQEIAG